MIQIPAVPGTVTVGIGKMLKYVPARILPEDRFAADTRDTTNARTHLLRNRETFFFSKSTSRKTPANWTTKVTAKEIAKRRPSLRAKKTDCVTKSSAVPTVAAHCALDGFFHVLGPVTRALVKAIHPSKMM
jgi:hypothetical protein